eukprot:15483401-Alexandrium_andersonii.AAC.1
MAPMGNASNIQVAHAIRAGACARCRHLYTHKPGMEPALAHGRCCSVTAWGKLNASTSRAEGHMCNSSSAHTCCSCCSVTAAPCFGLASGCSPAG